MYLLYKSVHTCGVNFVSQKCSPDSFMYFTFRFFRSKEFSVFPMSLYIFILSLLQIKSQTMLHSGASASAELSRLVAADLVPANLSKIGPELVSCQSLVANFVDSQKQLCGQVNIGSFIKLLYCRWNCKQIYSEEFQGN